MRIKRIEIIGFKSFADKTEIEMGDGLTAVVGPNGSGKSNLAEAVKWVLGEQSARTLRSTRMDEVIFSGTAKRKGVGFAEVTLVFDNSSHQLPSEFTEVAISRRVYRSGEGEYYINRRLCRLKDITELFLDTGIGKDSYSFVGQGRIDEILSADPRERRAIFEEAAGISRYKLRKRETENRLHETEQNLRRVLDITSELESQQRPLSSEADKAREYLGLQAQRTVWEKELLLYELGLAERQSVSISTQLERTNDDILQQSNTLVKLEGNQSALALLDSTLLSSVQETEQQLFETRVVRQQRHERQSELKSELDNLLLQTQVQQTRTQQYTEEIAQSNERLGQLIRDLVFEQERGEQVRSLLAALPQESGDSGSDLPHDLAWELAQAEAELSSTRAERVIMEKQLGALITGIAEKEQEQFTRQGILQQLAQSEATCQEDIKQLSQKMSGLSEDKRVINENISTCVQQHSLKNEALQKSQAALFQAQSRLRALRSADAQMEGLGRGAKFVLGLKLPGVLGVVGSLVTTAMQYETAVEVALGAAVADIVTDSEAVAKQAINLLKERGQGRATFYPLDTVRPRPLRDIPHAVGQHPGYKGRAADLVSVDPRLVPVVQQILGNVLIVDSLETVSFVAKATGYSWRIVTLDGDVSLPGGSLTGGSRPERQAWMLSRRREIEETESSVVALAAEIATVEHELSGLRESRGQAEQKQRALQEQIDLISRQLTEEGKRYTQISGRLAYLTGEHKNAINVLNSLVQEKAELATALSVAENAVDSATCLLESLRQQAKESAARAEVKREQAQARAVQSAALQVELAGITSSIAAQERLIRDHERQLEEAKRRYSASAEELSLSESKANEQNQRLEVLQAEIADLEQRERDTSKDLDGKKARRGSLHVEQREVVIQIDKARGELNSLRQKLHNLELRGERLKAEHEFLLQRFANNFPQDVQTQSRLNNRGEAEEEIARLDGKIVSLGPVRVSAINEFERLQERLSFLTGEQTDLQEASQELNNVIAELDKLMGERFLEGFGRVRKVFGEIAGRLFGGATARLSLLNPELPLESGIDIDVQPPGKRLQSLNLLSGGERAMVAVALLCAVLRVKPTPFCILDEIDAPLDDANVGRLMPVLHELCATTQFLIITHTKGTMMAADTLYGVTMPEQGISKVLAVKVSDIASA